MEEKAALLSQEIAKCPYLDQNLSFWQSIMRPSFALNFDPSETKSSFGNLTQPNQSQKTLETGENKKKSVTAENVTKNPKKVSGKSEHEEGIIPTKKSTKVTNK